MGLNFHPADSHKRERGAKMNRGSYQSIWALIDLLHLDTRFIYKPILNKYFYTPLVIPLFNLILGIHGCLGTSRPVLLFNTLYEDRKEEISEMSSTTDKCFLETDCKACVC